MITQQVKDVIRELEGVGGGRYPLSGVFADFCRIAALTIEAPFVFGQARADNEDEFGRIRAKYESVQPFAKCLGIVVEALDARREEFLGSVHEEIGAANTRDGQFFTPVSVANVMARINMEGVIADYRPGKIICLNDPACGASVTLIAGAEALMEKGVRQGDILIDAGDIDLRALDMSYIEMSLLGYAAIVRHENALTREVLSRPRFSPGYFLHGMPMRRRAA